MQTVFFDDLGVVEYGAAWQLQEALLQRNVAAKAAANTTGDSPATENFLLFCEHPHVYTLGKSGDQSHLLAGAAQLANLNATFFQTNRGGDITYHGPGQLVGYPVLDLEHYFRDLGKYMRYLEEVIIQTIAHYGLVGERLPGATGVWLDVANPARARKICAMGVRCSRWVTIHGFALNINTDLSYFGHIVPCGIADKGVTSLQWELGHTVGEAEVKALAKQAFARVFGSVLQPASDGPLFYTEAKMQALGAANEA